MSTETITLADIERQAASYAEAHEALRKHVETLELAIKAAKREALPNLMVLAAKAAGAKQALKGSLVTAPGLFAKPKTRLFAGVKVGFQKGKGETVIADETTTIKLIKQYFPKRVDTLIKTTEKPAKTALNQLSAADQKRLGITTKDATDEVVIKLMAGDVEALVDAFMRELDDDPAAIEGAEA